MKRVLFIPTILFIMFSCSKEQKSQTRELNITVKSTESVGTVNNDLRVVFFPNPFQDRVGVNIRGSDSAQILISNDNGDMKKISLIGSQITLDFSNEKRGTYYCEVLTKNTVFRTYLIKK